MKIPCDYNENNTSQSQSNTLITRFHSKHKILEVINSSSPPAQEHWYRLAQCLNSFHYPPLYTHHNLILSRPQAQKLLQFHWLLFLETANQLIFMGLMNIGNFHSMRPYPHVVNKPSSSYCIGGALGGKNTTVDSPRLGRPGRGTNTTR